MKIYDISMSIEQEMPVYGNRAGKRPVLEVERDYSTGVVYESRITMNMHTGTHVDAPLHMLQHGSTLDKMELKRMITVCKVLDLTKVEEGITEEDLMNRGIEPGDFILCKTKNSFSEAFQPDFVFLRKSGAAYLMENKVAGIGIDALGIERSQPEHETHKILFEAGIIVLEGLRLAEVKAGEYLLCALPLKIKGVEAAPARAVLIEVGQTAGENENDNGR